MNSRNKIICAGFLAVLAIVAGVWWAVSAHEPPQTITLSDGEVFRFAGATWGTNHIQPKILAHVVEALPKRWGDYVQSKFGARWKIQGPVVTAEASLCVWFERVGTYTGTPSAPGKMLNVYATLANERGDSAGRDFACGVSSPGYSADWLCFDFSEWPRRGRTSHCQLREVNFYISPPTTNDLGQVTFSNLREGRFPQWEPEPLPVTKSDGDLTVRLEKLFTRPIAYLTPPPRETAFLLKFSSPRTNETWAVEDAELSDATGNQITIVEPQYYGGTPEAGISGRIPEALWPDESALRLKLALKRIAGYPPGDLITFSNLPLTAASSGMFPSTGISLTNVASGISIVVHNYLTQPMDWNGPAPGPFWVDIEPPDPRSGLAVDIIDVVTDTGEKLERGAQSESWWNFRSVPPGTKSLTVTVAVQKMRHVEFTAKPKAE